MSITLRPYQQTAVNRLFWDLQQQGNSLCVLPTGCHEIDYPIVMSDGSIKKVQDIKVGDFVMGIDYLPKRVIDLHRGNEKSFEVIPSDGYPFRVNQNHILPFTYHALGVGETYPSRNFSLKIKDFVKRRDSTYFNARLIQHDLKTRKRYLIPFQVIPIGKMDYYGFTLDTSSPFNDNADYNALFLDGQGFVQHNSGKSVVIANFAKKIHSNVLILSPSKEITAQNSKKLLLYVPRNQVGIYSASFNSKQVRKFTFATIGSIYKKAELFQNFGIIIADECDTIDVKNLKGMYSSFIEKVSQIRGAKVKVFGFTATPYRNMQGYHTDKNGVLQSATTLKLINRIQPKFWQRIIHNVSVKDLMNDGYLSPLKYVDKLEFDHQRIPQNKSGSDFDLHKFSMMLMPHEKRILEDIKEYQDVHKSVLVFCSWVKDAMRYSEILKGSAFVHGKTKPKERDKIIEDFKTGQIKTIFNVGVLGIGFDHPELDAIVMLRPTRSLRLFYQFIGRGLRIAPGKTHCTVYDYTSNVNSLGRIETIELVKEKGLLDHKPMWQIKSSAGYFHNKPLYEFEVQKKEKENNESNLQR